MKKILSILALLAAFMFVGGAAHATPAYPDQASCEAAGNVWDNGSCFPVGDNADGIDCPGGPQYNVTECQPVATPVPESPAVVVPAPAPAPVPEAVPAPAPVPEPLPVPATEQPVERTELAYTGVEDVMLATVGLAVGLGGVALVRYSLQMRREA